MTTLGIMTLKGISNIQPTNIPFRNNIKFHIIILVVFGRKNRYFSSSRPNIPASKVPPEPSNIAIGRSSREAK